MTLNPGVLLLLPGLCHAISRPVEFVIQEGSTTQVTFSLSTGAQDTETILYSGSILTDLNFNEESLKGNSLNFKGGRIYVSDADFTLNGTLDVQQVGTVSAEITVSTRNLSQTASTLVPAGVVIETSQRLRNEDHQFTLDQGTTSVRITALGSSQLETINYAQTPESDEPLGTATLSIEEVGLTENVRTLLCTLHFAIDETESELLAGTTTRLEGREVGTATAVGFVELPTDLAKWTTANQVSITTGEERNALGIPYLLLFAFDQPATARSVPIRITPGEFPRYEFDLPETGLKANLVPYYSTTLKADSWQLLPAEFFIDGPQSLNKGSKLRRQLRIHDPNPFFIRIHVRP